MQDGFIKPKSKITIDLTEQYKQLEAVLGIAAIDELPLTIDNTILFKHYFDFVSISGKGSFGMVIKVVDKKRADYAAIKIIPLNHSDSKNHQIQMRAEANILKSMRNDNIVNFREVYESNDYVFLVMDHLRLGSLSILIKKRRLTDFESSQVIKGILSGLRYIHSKDYIHRDLKPENILVKDIDDLSSVVIADFGLGTKQDMGFSSLFKGKCGTIIYMAPEETNNSNYSYSVDIWATGLIMYTLICGSHPLYKPGETDEDYLPKLHNLNWEFPTEFTSIAKDFFLKLCDRDPCNRYDAITALNHPWITRDLCSPIPRPLNEQMKEIINIKQFMAVCRACIFLSRKQSKIEIDNITPSIIILPMKKSDTLDIRREYYDDFPISSFHKIKLGTTKNSVSLQNKSRIPCLTTFKSDMNLLMSKDAMRMNTANKKEKPLSSNKIGFPPVCKKALTQKFLSTNVDIFQAKSNRISKKHEIVTDIAKKEGANKCQQMAIKPITHRPTKIKSIVGNCKKPLNKHIIL